MDFSSSELYLNIGDSSPDILSYYNTSMNDEFIFITILNFMYTLSFIFYLQILILFYMKITQYIYILIRYENKRAQKVIKDNNIKDNNINDIKHTKPFKNILDDTELSDDIKYNVLDNLLNTKSLNKYYIIYFIFAKQYDYYVLNNTNIPGQLDTTPSHLMYIKKNSYVEYKKIKRLCGGSRYCNLDESVKLNLTVFLYKNSSSTITKQFETCTAHINFISWVYYSGLYDYLMNDINIKKKIVDELNNKELLYGDTFLQYIIFTTQLEAEIAHEIAHEIEHEIAHNAQNTLIPNKNLDIDIDSSEISNTCMEEVLNIPVIKMNDAEEPEYISENAETPPKLAVDEDDDITEGTKEEETSDETSTETSTETSEGIEEGTSEGTSEEETSEEETSDRYTK